MPTVGIERGRYEVGKGMAQKANIFTERVVGQEHLETLMSISILALCAAVPRQVRSGREDGLASARQE
jgi:hypothetical protein